MSCSVNMVPEASLRAQARAKRLVRWLVTCTLAALLLAAGWIVQYMAAAGLARFGGETGRPGSAADQGGCASRFRPETPRGTGARATDGRGHQAAATLAAPTRSTDRRRPGRRVSSPQ